MATSKNTEKDTVPQDDGAGAVISGTQRDAATEDQKVTSSRVRDAEAPHDPNFDPPNFGDQEQNRG